MPKSKSKKLVKSKRSNKVKSTSFFTLLKNFFIELFNSYKNNKQFRFTVGIVLLFFTFFLFFSCISYLFVGKEDQSVIQNLGDYSIVSANENIQNWLGLLGAITAHFFISSIGVSALLFIPLLFCKTWHILTGQYLCNFRRFSYFSIFMSLWIGLLLGYIALIIDSNHNLSFLCGHFGLLIAMFFNHLIKFGTPFLLIISMVIFIINFYKITLVQKEQSVSEPQKQTTPKELKFNFKPFFNDIKNLFRKSPVPVDFHSVQPVNNQGPILPFEEFKDSKRNTQAEDIKIIPINPENPSNIEKETSKFMEAEDGDLWDPTLELSRYEFPSTNLLINRQVNKIIISRDELERKKNNIINTLKQFKIDIKSIKATIGPTVTLYEIVPDEGVKIARIKNLENDIALNLAALGIRMIAPMPGKGTIGIEIPNEDRQIVSLKNVLESDMFKNTKEKIPVILGKTIRNSVHIVDLTKMPHLLVAGATGQGKSVFINCVLASILYKIHPSYLKFVLIDPKKVELSLFNLIEKHYLATLPDAEESILTEPQRIVEALKSLCVEMSNRYNLLKKASTRNITEYNKKFCERRLNPKTGHRFLPYIVVVIDELADLMMTSGKEVEYPIARLAQLARAIGIHLIVATQRPSVDVITGIIKANFPARLAFKVSSKIDSRTILDANGADQLVGMGDMLLSMNSDVIRLQCPFIETLEVEVLCGHIGEQQSFANVYMLPICEAEDQSVQKIEDKDSLFLDAARLIVLHQQGSTSLIQRKLKLGYNRAGRIIDQLEQAGIVGPFEGSKARQVLVHDENSLEQLLGE